MVPFGQSISIERGRVSEVLYFQNIAFAEVLGRTCSFPAPLVSYPRSSIKPLVIKSLLPFLDVGGWSLEEKAITTSSHSGEDRHLRALNKLSARLSAGELKIPVSGGTGRRGLPGGAVSSMHHPCSGEHLAILLAAQFAGWPTSSYLEATHPNYRVLQDYIERVLGHNPQGTAFPDGCDLPTATLPMEDLAKLYAHLAQDADSDWVFSAMSQAPEMVGGEGRLDTEIMMVGGGQVIAKEGADGLLALGVRADEGRAAFGLVFKNMHGDDRRAHHLLYNAVADATSLTKLAAPKLKGQKVVLSAELQNWLKELKATLLS